MPSDIVTLPSGMSGLVTALKGRSMRLLGDKQAMRSGLFLDKIFDSCWSETISPGPYAFQGRPDWSKVLLGDRQYLLVQIRAKTFGPMFAFQVRCPNPNCNARFEHDLDLTELPVKTLSEEASRSFVDGGNVLEGQMPGEDRTFRFKLYTGADEIKAIKMSGATTDPLSVLKARVLEIEGLDARGKDLFFEDADWDVLYALLAEMDRFDCGIETKIQVYCPDCSEEVSLEIPFGSGGFLAPSKRSTQTNR